eukprot:9646542-Ditylum_brightwellii.AAC.1
MDNLFNSALIYSTAMHCCPKKVLTQGVVWQNYRGVLACVTWEQLSGKRADTACDTVKAAVLQGDSHADAIIIAS